MNWNQRYIDNDTPWDNAAPAAALNELLSAFPQFFTSDSRALVLGCGRGYDADHLQRHGLDVTGLDISPAAIDHAKNTNAEVTWLCEDLFTHSHEQARSYDLIFEHTCFCIFPPEQQSRYIEAAQRLLKPGGLLVGVFLVASEPDLTVGPPFFSRRETICAGFENAFSLQWEGKPSAYTQGHEDREWLMIWRRTI